MMKKTRTQHNRWLGKLLCTGLCMLAFAFLLPMSARADAIFEPQNQFYLRHQEDCEYLNRTCTAREDTVLWKTPNSAFEKGVLEKGEPVYVSVVYTDKKGLKWGLTDGEDVWVLLADMDLTYGSEEFLAEYWNDIKVKDPVEIPAGTKVVLWTYPQSGVTRGPDGGVRTFSTALSIEPYYTDPSGREWGYSAYFQGERDLWICLSDMENEKIPGAQEEEPVPAQELTEELRKELPQSRPLKLWMIVLPVLLVAGVSGILLWQMFGKRKEKKND